MPVIPRLQRSEIANFKEEQGNGTGIRLVLRPPKEGSFEGFWKSARGLAGDKTGPNN